MTFHRKSQSGKVIGYTVRESWGLRKKTGQVGIELECEGTCLPGVSTYDSEDDDYVFTETDGVWVYHKDHSLRGDENAEYVLSEPVKFTDVPKVVYGLFDMIEAYGASLDISNRTSVHVHLNCQDFTAKEVATFSALYLALEEVLTEFCGDHRVGNLFCLRAKDAPAIVTELRKLLSENLVGHISDHYHYAGFNIQALAKFGSIEIRTMRGLTEPHELIRWVSMLQRIYDKALELKDPREVCYMFSAKGPIGFINSILGSDNVSAIVSDIDWTEQQLSRCLYDGIRMVQPLCYQTLNWDTFERAGTDPFGRSKKKVASAPAGYEVYSSEIYNEIPPLQTNIWQTHSLNNISFDAETMESTTHESANSSV